MHVSLLWIRLYYFVLTWIPIIAAIWDSSLLPGIGLTVDSSSGWAVVTWSVMAAQLMLWLFVSSSTTLNHGKTWLLYTLISVLAIAVVTTEDDVFQALWLMGIIPPAHTLYVCREDSSHYLFSYSSTHRKRFHGLVVMVRDSVFGSMFSAAAIMLVNVLVTWADERHAESLRIVFILEYGFFVAWVVTCDCRFKFQNRLTHVTTNRYESGKQVDPQANPFTGIFALMALLCVVIYEDDFDVVLAAIVASVGVFGATVAAFVSQAEYLRALDTARAFKEVDLNLENTTD